MTFDGVPLDQGIGWARALFDSGAAGVEEREGPLVTVRRLRRYEGGPVSIEASSLPAVGPLADLPACGLAEHVVSLLDAEHFRFHLTFGEQR